MFFVLPALASSLAYSTDAVIVRSALEKMPLHVFIFVLALLYAVVAVGLWMWRGREISAYVADKRNRKTMCNALLGLVMGTIVADGLMYLAIQRSSLHDLPLTITLIHTAPVLSLLLVWAAFGAVPNWKVCTGIALTVAGSAMAIMCSDPSRLKDLA